MTTAASPVFAPLSIRISICLSLGCACTSSLAGDPPPAAGHHEDADSADRAVAPTAPPPKVAVTPAAVVERNGYVSVQVNVDADGNNIVGDAANEPSIAVDPNDPRRAVIGWRQFDTIQSNFREAGVGWTADGGATWTFPGAIDNGQFRSDPILDVDADGRFFYNSLAPGFINIVYLSEDGGRTFDAGTFAWGGDKTWMAIDRTGGVGHGNIYANWTRAVSSCDGQYTRSYDFGESFEPCVDVPGTPFWGTLAIDADGAVYIASSGHAVVKSSTIQDRNEPVAFDFVAPVDMGGAMIFSGGPNPGGLVGQTWIDTDVSGGPNHGNVYMLASVSPEGTDPADVMFARSEDGGLTWSAPHRVNDDLPGVDAWQWFGTLGVAPNGRIDAFWVDTRETLVVNMGALYYAFSQDGGRTWSENIAVSPVFDSWLGWPQQNKLGDYYDVFSLDDAAHLAYSATFNGEQDVYHLRLEPPVCPDFDGDSVVGFADLLALLAAWGPCAECPEDIDGDGAVDFEDLVRLLAAWGRCVLACCIAADDCIDAPEIGTGPVRFSTILASTDGGSLPPECDEGAGVRLRKDVWLRFVAPRDGTVTASVCEATFDNRIAVYAGDACPGAVIACGDDVCGDEGTRGSATFVVSAGASYLIRIGASREIGTGVLDVAYRP